MAAKRRHPTDPKTTFHTFQEKAQVIIRFKPEAGMRMVGTELASVSAADVSGIQAMIKQLPGVTVSRLFEQTETALQDKARAIVAATGAKVPDLSPYYAAQVPYDQADKLVENLAREALVDAAYVKPPAEPAGILDEEALPAVGEAPLATPDFTAQQGYIDPAPGGIDARFAWTRAGGGGAGVAIIDIEGEWNFNHEDLLLNQGGVVGGTPPGDPAWRNHGTNVGGEFSGDHNAFGISGICADAMFSGYSIYDHLGNQDSANAIIQAANRLNAGDIILIELHRPGPQGYIAIEWWPDDFDAIQFATAKGIVVIEAAGNGYENLDDAIYNNPLPGFPPDWVNPFNRTNRDSGAIIVGAGAPPPGTHGRNHGPDRSRLDFSNYGSIVDAQGWGREVTTTGGRRDNAGDLQGGSDENKWYTDRFSGTSSASPIVVGAVGCCQGALKAAGRTLLTPADARSLLRSTGSPQTDAPGRPASQRIGNRPDLKTMFDQKVPRKGCLLAAIPGSIVNLILSRRS